MDNDKRNETWNDENQNRMNDNWRDTNRDTRRDSNFSENRDTSRESSFSDRSNVNRESNFSDKDRSRFNKDESNKVLYYLDELSDYKVASDYKDIRGWEVVDAQDRTIGEVDDLLVNRNTERVVYLDVEVDDDLARQVGSANDVPAIQGTHSFINEDGENHVIVPVGTVDIDEDNKKVYARDIAYEKFLNAKWIRKGTPIDRDYEMETLRNYFPEGYQGFQGDRDDTSFYNRREFRHGYKS